MKTLLCDSSCWIELISEGPHWEKCETLLSQAERVIVPSIILFEVYKKIKSSISEDKALEAISFLSSFEVVDLDRTQALNAADLSISMSLGMADSLILAAARDNGAHLITLDNDFRGIPGVTVIG